METIFLTGASGLIGNACLYRALTTDFRVRACFRSEEKADKVRRSLGPLAKNLECIIIKDFTVDDVFDDIVRGVEYIVHCASPLWTADWGTNEVYKEFVEPAVESTRNILNAALKSPSVQKVVLTTSPAAVTTYAQCFGPFIDGITYTASHRVSDNFYAQADQPGYFWGKTLSLNLTDRFAANNPERNFDIININPTSAIGPFRSAGSTSELLASSNIRGLAVAVGREISGVPTSAVHVDDVARLHIDVLKMATPKYFDFGAGVDVKLSTHEEIMKKNFADAISDGRFSMDGKLEDRRFLWDASETEEFFGWKFRGFEDMVKDVAEQYLLLLEKER